MRSRSRVALGFAAFVALICTLTSCTSPPVLDTLGEGDEQAPAPTATEPPPQPITLDDISLVIPEDWYWAQVELERLEGLIFVQNDPDELAEFDDPDLALPLDYAAGALIITPLPQGSDAETLSEAMLSALADLTGDDLDAMLLPLDQAGLIDHSAVEGVQLLQARADMLAGLPALAMDGTATFADDLPPELRIQVYLTWTEDSFVAFYALAAEQAWPNAEAPLAAALETISIR